MTREQQLEQVQAYINKWQEILKLQAWEIRAVIVNSSEINGRLAQANYNTHTKLALVSVAEEGTYNKGVWEDLCSLEISVAHELVHILMYPMDDFWFTVENELSPSARNIAQQQFETANEQVTEALARILVNLKGGQIYDSTYENSGR